MLQKVTVPSRNSELKTIDRRLSMTAASRSPYPLRRRSFRGRRSSFEISFAEGRVFPPAAIGPLRTVPTRSADDLPP